MHAPAFLHQYDLDVHWIVLCRARVLELVLARVCWAPITTPPRPRGHVVMGPLATTGYPPRTGVCKATCVDGSA